MKNSDDFLEKVITSLYNNQIIKPVFSLDNFNYSDEVKIYRYSLHTRQKSQFFKRNNLPEIKKKVDAGGVSISSRNLALIKCVSEFAERFSLYYYDKSDITISSYNDLKNALNPRIYKNVDLIEEMPFSWEKGVDFMEKREIYIPNQLIHLHRYFPDPVNLSPGISTGAASAFDKNTALLRGIYEVIERDAFMTTYLAKVKVPKIDISTIKDGRIQDLFEKAKRYNLDMSLFDITTNVNIPVYLTILIDRTGIGPAVLLGTKASLNRIEAILGSMEESFMGRSWIRAWMSKGRHLKYQKKYVKIETQLHRALLWANAGMIKELEYLDDQMEQPFKGEAHESTLAKDLKKVKEIIGAMGYKIYYKEITYKLFQEFGYVVVKTIIPGLQPLYLDESEKEIIQERVESVAKHFGMHKFMVNKVPHPFL